jgi:hypothetical protein
MELWTCADSRETHALGSEVGRQRLKVVREALSAEPAVSPIAPVTPVHPAKDREEVCQVSTD